MLRTGLVGFLAIFVGLLPATALAQDDRKEDRDDVVVRLNGDFQLPAGESVGSVVVFRGDARIVGTVRDALVVVDGDAIIEGRVNGDVTVVSGDLFLRAQSTVHNIVLIRSSLVEAPGSTITGDVTRRSRLLFPGAAIVFGVLLWVTMTVTVVVSGLLFAAIGGRQLVTAATSLTARPGQTILGGVIVIVGVPMAAVVALVSVVGLAAGLGLLLFVLPALLFLGLLVAGTWLGGLITKGLGRQSGAAHPYLEAVVGLALIQLALLIPGLGAIAAGLLAVWGAGGLAYLAWLAFRSGPGIAGQPPRGSDRPEEPASVGVAAPSG